MGSGSEEGSYLRLIDYRIESNKGEEECSSSWPRTVTHGPVERQGVISLTYVDDLISGILVLTMASVISPIQTSATVNHAPPNYSGHSKFN